MELLILIYDPYANLFPFLHFFFVFHFTFTFFQLYATNCRSIIPLRMSKVQVNLLFFLSFLHPAVGTFGVYSKADI